ncbi:MAG: magnesium/cobalt transporter CorA [Candidatus Aenigmarchaeota archaeon]|nr:magnesium/cobalt transporter CorA [Candidatus Aenigmarchaeota archaeon]
MIDAFVLEKGVKRTNNLKTNRRIWADVTDPTKSDLEKLAQSFHLHHLTLEDCSKTGNRVKLEQFNEYLFIITYGLESSKKGPLAFQMNFVLGKNFLLTVHKEKVSSFDSLKSDSRRLHSLLSRGPDLLMHHLMDIEIDFYFPVLDEIEDQIDELEEEVYRNIDQKVLGRMFRLKRQLLTIRKRVGPQKEIVLMLTQKSFPFISDHASAYYRDIYDHIIRINESIDDYREILSNTLEVHLSMVSNRMNEVMKALTIVATVMLPLSVLTGIYGMNLNIPESHIDFMYYVVLSLMVIIAAIMILYFRRKRWI